MKQLCENRFHPLGNEERSKYLTLLDSFLDLSENTRDVWEDRSEVAHTALGLLAPFCGVDENELSKEIDWYALSASESKTQAEFATKIGKEAKKTTFGFQRRLAQDNQKNRAAWSETVDTLRQTLSPLSAKVPSEVAIDSLAEAIKEEHSVRKSLNSPLTLINKTSPTELETILTSLLLGQSFTTNSESSSSAPETVILKEGSQARAEGSIVEQSPSSFEGAGTDANLGGTPSTGRWRVKDYDGRDKFSQTRGDKVPFGSIPEAYKRRKGWVEDEAEISSFESRLGDSFAGTVPADGPDRATSSAPPVHLP